MKVISHRFVPLQLLILSAVSVTFIFIFQGNVGFSLADEGFLWYGVKRVMLGEVPIRDFMAYDPGRYYVSAAFMKIWDNDGIMSLRKGLAVFQVVGLFAGLVLIDRSLLRRSPLFLLVSTIILLLWMYPRHKMFDISVSILSVGLLTYLVEKPILLRFFLAGLYMGFLALIGRNHFIYATIGFAGVVIWLHIAREEGEGKTFLQLRFWIAGLLLGISPLIVMFIAIPGFMSSFFDSILFLFEIKRTNLSLPIPRPWAANTMAEFLIGIFFICIVAFGIIMISYVILMKLQKRQVRPAVAATAFMALPYAHYAFSRADVNHLAHGIFPMILGCLVLLSLQEAKIKWFCVLGLFLSSFWIMKDYQEGMKYVGNKDKWVPVEISGDTILVSSGTAENISLLRKLEQEYAEDGQSFIVVPFWPGAYSLLDRKSPVWDIYGLFPRNMEFEIAEIKRIEEAKPVFALIIDFPLDGNEKTRFRNTHPVLNEYIQENFEAVSDTPGPTYKIYKKPGHT